MSHEEQQYLNLIRDILDKGSLEQGRNGNTISVFGASMRFSLAEGTVPILTTKKTAWVTVCKTVGANRTKVRKYNFVTVHIC